MEVNSNKHPTNEDENNNNLNKEEIKAEKSNTHTKNQDENQSNSHDNI